MTLKAAHKLLTADAFLKHPSYRGRELIDGRVVPKSLSAEADHVTGLIAGALGEHVEGEDRAMVFGPLTGYACFPDPATPTVRKPDVSVFPKSRLPGGKIPLGFFVSRPDLICESVSCAEGAMDVERKVMQFLAAGVPVAWIIYSPLRTARVYSADGSSRLVREDDWLDGGAVLPGFSVQLRDVLPPPRMQHPL